MAFQLCRTEDILLGFSSGSAQAEWGCTLGVLNLMCFLSWSLWPGMLKGAQVHAQVFQRPECVAVRMLLKKLNCRVIIDQDLLKV